MTSPSKKTKVYVGYDDMYDCWEVHTSLRGLKEAGVAFYFEVLVPKIKHVEKKPANIGLVELELLDLAA